MTTSVAGDGEDGVQARADGSRGDARFAACDG